MQHYCLTDKSMFVEYTDPKLDYGREWTYEDMEDGCRQYVQDLSDDEWTYVFRRPVLPFIVRYRTKYKGKKKIPKNKIAIVGLLAFIKDPIDIDTVHDDPLPSHTSDGYWSGYRVNDMWVKDDTKALGYAEDDDIPALAQGYANFPLEIKLRNGDDRTLTDADELSRYIRNVAVIGLINEDGDNYIRYILLNGHVKRSADYVGMLVCRCGDCGKRAQGIFRGNPDMGDPWYQIQHRKDWFCSNFKWTYMGGHGCAGGRRMICPSCSVKYQEEEERKRNGGDME